MRNELNINSIFAKIVTAFAIAAITTNAALLWEFNNRLTRIEMTLHIGSPIVLPHP